MKLSAVQAYLAAQIAANTTLAGFGSPILASLESDETVVKALIDECLRTPGVCIEIAEPIGTSLSELHPGGYTKLRAQVEIFVAEKIASPTHTPRGLELIELVAAALTGGRQPVEWAGHESFLSENGYSLHVLSFTTPVLATK